MSNNMNTAIASREAAPVVESGEIRDYISLLKPRVMSLVVFTGLVGLFLAPNVLHPLFAIIAIFCIALGSGSAGAINMWYERDIDALMERTKNRAIPSGRLSPESAFDFAIVMSFSSVFLMLLFVNIVAALLLLIAILYYVFIYTIWLKKRTPQNIVIGGASGAFPPLIGWAAVTGGISIEPIILFAIIFIWTPPHFWSLSLYRCKDYEKAGIPMLPVVSGTDETKRQILIYTIFLLPVVASPFFIGMSGLVYLIGSSLLSLLFLMHAIKVFRNPVEANARKMFKFSIFYLFAVFSLLVIDRLTITQVF